MIVVVCGALANRPANGGGAWTRVSWAIGLMRLGCDVYFVEQMARNSVADRMARLGIRDVEARSSEQLH